MRILLSAASCSPYKGSEPAVGWKVARALADHHEVHVMVFGYHREELGRAAAEGLCGERLHFHYLGEDWRPQSHPLKDKLQHWSYYRRYVAEVRGFAMRLHEEHPFDIIQHVTFATWRNAVPLHGLGVPFIWGPVGGAETFPVAMLTILSPSGIVFELLRYGANWVSYFSPALRDMIRKADAVVPSHPDVTRLLRRIRGSEAGLHPLLVTAFTAGERERIEELSPTPKLPGAPLEAFCGGLLEGRKGVSLAIRAIALAKPRGLRIHYRICAHGPELQHLEKLTRQLGLENEVTFQAPLRGSAYHQALNDADIYLLPSLRDNAPLTLMEAMLAGCVPVVADCGGPAFIVTRECGIKVTVRTASKAIAQIADALLELQAAPDLRATLGERAKQRIRENFTMERYLEETHRIYRAAGYSGSFDSSDQD